VADARPAVQTPDVERRRRVGRAILAGTGLLLGGVGCLWVTNEAVLRAARPHIHWDVERVPTRTVAIVPGARVYEDGRPYPVLEDRLEAARRLFELGRVHRILVSGDHRDEGYDEPDGMRRWLVDAGVSPDAVFTDHAGLRTLDTMQRAARVFQVKDAIVCTNEFHLARSVFLARHAGIDAVGVVVDRRRYSSHTTNTIREAVARTRAWLDVFVLGTEPRHLGPSIPIDGDASASFDRRTAASSSGLARSRREELRPRRGDR
jgi:SanA protein